MFEKISNSLKPDRQTDKSFYNVHLSLMAVFFTKSSRNASFSKNEAELQEIFAQHKIYRSILDHTFPILFVIFGGPWSDYYGRKGVLLVTTVGTVAYAVATLIGSLYVDRLDPLWLNIISVIPRMLTGVRKEKYWSISLWSIRRFCRGWLWQLWKIRNFFRRFMFKIRINCKRTFKNGNFFRKCRPIRSLSILYRFISSVPNRKNIRL